MLRDVLEPDVHLKYYLGETALARIERRHKKFQPQVNPDKTGTVSIKNNSSELNVDHGTTLIGLLHHDGELREVDKANCIVASYHKGMDNHGQRTMVAWKVQDNGNLRPPLGRLQEVWGGRAGHRRLPRTTSRWRS